MSISTRFKPESADSPASGDVPDQAEVRDESPPKNGPIEPSAPRAERTVPARLDIELEVSPQRSISWTVFGLIVGALLIWKLGTVGVWVGIVLMAMGAYHAWNLVQTVIHPPGTIIVTDKDVTLPRG